MKKRTIVITAGGTHEKIDEVRKITNMSTGALGVNIAKELETNYSDQIDQIYYITSKHAKQPSGEHVNVLHAESTEDLLQTIERLLTTKEVHYFIHAAAVSDYTTDYVTNPTLIAEELASAVTKYVLENQQEYQPEALKEILLGKLVNPTLKMDNASKISSKNEQLIVTLKQTEKIISKIKALSPKTFLVGFKLLNGVSEEELFDVAFQNLRKNRCNLVLANDLSLIREGKHTGMLVYPEKKCEFVVGKENIAKKLVYTMFKRGETRYPNSVCVSEQVNVPETVLRSFHETGKKLFDHGFLPIVERGTYGNMSIKQDGKFMITGRNVQKGKLTNDLLVEIEHVETFTKEKNESVYAKISYKGKVKPSIDTAIHHFIYEKTNHTAIVHIHTDKVFEGYPLSDYNYACGTEEEMESIVSLINEGTDLVQMNKHGIIVLGDSLENCLLKIEHVFESSWSIEPMHQGKDHEELTEWLEHVEEVRVQTGVTNFFEEKNIYKVLLGETKKAVVYVKEQPGKLQFVLYGLQSQRQKGEGVGKHVILILESIAKTKGIPTLQLLTTAVCDVKNYYENKHGFKEMPSESALLVLEKKI